MRLLLLLLLVMLPAAAQEVGTCTIPNTKAPASLTVTRTGPDAFTIHLHLEGDVTLVNSTMAYGAPRQPLDVRYAFSRAQLKRWASAWDRARNVRRGDFHPYGHEVVGKGPLVFEVIGLGPDVDQRYIAVKRGDAPTSQPALFYILFDTPQSNWEEFNDLIDRILVL